MTLCKFTDMPWCGALQMAWASIPLRRSARLQHGDPSTTAAPPSPEHNNDSGSLAKPIHLPDLGPDVELFLLPERDIEFNADYLNSQKHHEGGYSRWEEAYHNNESHGKMELGGA